jgi:nucleoside-specific outer membrane channel protein Tsx
VVGKPQYFDLALFFDFHHLIRTQNRAKHGIDSDSFNKIAPSFSTIAFAFLSGDLPLHLATE